MNDDLIDLQTKQSFQEQLLEELNQIVTDQQQQITRLENAILGMKNQLETLQSTTEESQMSEHELPPHY
jgi:SlyX protein